MGFLKKMGKAMGHAVAQAGKKTAAAIKKKRLQSRVERQILERFTMDQLKKMISEYGFKGPELPERGYYKKSDYVEYAFNHFKLKTVIEWARKHRIPIRDIMEYYKKEMERIEKEYGSTKEGREEDRKQGVEEIEVEPSEFEGSAQPPAPSWEFNDEKQEFMALLDKIERVFGSIIKDLKIDNEKELQNQLYMFLRSHYPSKTIQQRVDWRADMLIDGKYALELKYADNRGTLDTGVREVKAYKKHTPYVAVIIFDMGKLPGEVLDEYIEYYRDDGAEVVVLQGRGGRKRQKRRGVYVELR